MSDSRFGARPLARCCWWWVATTRLLTHSCRVFLSWLRPCRWKEHLEDKAALVQAACGEYTVEEEEETLFPRPVQVDWMKHRYPVNAFGSRF